MIDDAGNRSKQPTNCHHVLWSDSDWCTEIHGVTFFPLQIREKNDKNTNTKSQDVLKLHVSQLLKCLFPEPICCAHQCTLIFKLTSQYYIIALYLCCQALNGCRGKTLLFE